MSLPTPTSDRIREIKLPGDSRYRWWGILPAVSLILLVTNGFTVGAIAAFDPTLMEQLGASRADLKLGDTLQFAVTALLTLFSGWLADRFSVRLGMALGCSALAWAFFTLSKVDSLGDYYLVRVWMGVGLSGAGLALCVIVVARWFPDRRGLALGLMLAGNSLSNAAFPRLFTDLIATEGWRPTALVAAWTVGFLLLLIALAIREWPAGQGSWPGGSRGSEAATSAETPAGPQLGYREILRKREFWLIGIAAFATFYTILGVTNNMILHMQSLGVPARVGSLMAVPLYVAGVAGKLGAGWCADLLGRKPVWLACIALMLVAASMLATLSAPLVPIAAVVLGLGWGANYTLVQVVTADVFGTRSLGKVMGALTVLDAGGGALGPFITASIADSTGSYRGGFLAIVALLVIALACVSRLGIARQVVGLDTGGMSR